jgi:non-specific serine/threonine protein kinase
LGPASAEATSFVGRREELAELKRLVPALRLVTLTGVGGCGKTRLALRAARELRRAFADGVWWADLAPLADPSLLAHLVADELDLDDQTDRPVRDVLVEYVRDRDLLIVMDNCEHLVDACADLVGTMLAAAPRLRVVCTSRQPLGIIGEQVVVVAPLPVERNASTVAPAVRLFAERAAAASPGFALSGENLDAVTRICRDLDGLPLAIELAAARLRVLSLGQLSLGLRDRFRLLAAGRAEPARHRTLEATFDWSYRLCAPPERALWARLGVFADGFDLPAVEAVCADEQVPAAGMLSALAELVDQSVLLREDATGRYRLLNTVRAFGLARLGEQAGQEAVLRRRHRDYFLELAARGEVDWCGSAQEDGYLRLRGEHANLRAALDHCLRTPGEEPVGLRLAGTLWFYWTGCGFLREGRHWLDRVLTAVAAAGPDRTKGLWALGAVAVAQGDARAAGAALDECRAAAARAGDERLLGYAELSQGTVALFADDYARAGELFGRALDRFQASGQVDPAVLLGRSELAMVTAIGGDLDRADGICLETLRLCAQRGDRWSAAWALHVRALTATARGDTAVALERTGEGLRLHQAFGNLTGLAMTLDLHAQLLATAGAAERAATVHGATDQIWRVLGRRLFGSPALAAQHDATVARIRARIGERGYDVSYRNGTRLGTDEAIAYALAEEPPAEEPPAEESPAAQLTRREREVAELVAQGLSNRQIATRLVTSQRTAESHVENILRKLRFTSRSQIAAWMARGDDERT